MSNTKKFKKPSIFDHFIDFFFRPEIVRINLGILGYSGSGKTELFHQLMQKPRKDYRTTSGFEKINQFELKTKGTKLKFEKTKDYSGKPVSVKAYFKENIENKSHLIITFNIINTLEKEMNELGYLQNAHLHLQENQKIIYIGSFYDKVKAPLIEDDVKSFLEERIKNFSLKGTLILANLKSKEDINKILEKIIEK